MNKKKKLFLAIIVSLLIMAAIVVANYNKKQNIIEQAETIATEKGLLDVNVEILGKDSTYGWYDIVVYCSNFHEFKHSQMKTIHGAISSIDDVYVSRFVADGNTFVVYDDSVYYNGEQTHSFDDPSNAYSPSKNKSGYSLTKGVNGTYIYRCQKNCNDSCKLCKNSCIKGRENFGGDCTHEYKAKSPIGWIGCPLCGDVDNTYWHEWYREALTK